MASAYIYAIRTVSGNQPNCDRIIEDASQTFLLGVPVQIAADGGIKEWDGVTTTNAIAGISNEAASNLTTLGVAKTLTFGSVPFQSSAVNIPRGAPLNDGRIGLYSAAPDNVFFGEVGPSQTPVAADLGLSYGLTKDTDGHWFVDRTKTGASVVVKIVKLDTIDTARGVHFVILPAAAQLIV